MSGQRGYHVQSVRGSVRHICAAVGTIVALLLCLAPSALASPVDIHSSGPLSDIWIGDDLSCEAVLSGQTSGDFFAGQTTGPASCGSVLSLTGGNSQADGTYGLYGASGDFTSVSAPALSGSGTSQDPYVVTTEVSAGSTGVDVTETDSYVVGDSFYTTQITVTNNSDFTWSGGVYHAGDCYLNGNDGGYGFQDTADHGIACSQNPNNSPVGGLMEFEDLTGGAHLFEGSYETATTTVPQSQMDYDGTCECTTSDDNGEGINWDFTSLQPGQHVAFSLRSVFTGPSSPPPTSAPTPVSTGAPTVTSGSSAVVSGSATPNGLSTTGRWIYGLDASYRGPGFSGNVYDQSTSSQNVGSDYTSHTVSFPLTGLMPNSVYHVKFVATNSDGTTVGPDQTFTTPAASLPAVPPAGKENFIPHGKLFVLVNGQFVKLTGAVTLPSGTVVDAQNGSLTLVSSSLGGGQATDAKAKKGKKPKVKKTKTYTGTFTGGVFKVTQTESGPSKGLTTLTIMDKTPAFKGAASYATTCKAHAAGDPSATAAHIYRIYSVSGRARGRYSTRGRYGAGTVRGTAWTVSDRCDGTLISVQLHSVLVTDFAKHKTVVVTAGHHYLAKAPAKKKK